MRMPAKTTELTTQVDPKSRDKLVTPRVSSSKNAAPMKNRGGSKPPPVTSFP